VKKTININPKNKKLALFYAEASLKIGTGHIMRCLVLAKFLSKKGWNCKFVSSQESYELIPNLRDFDKIKPSEMEKNPITNDLLVFDNYQIDIEYEKKFRAYSKIIMVIDDLSNRSHQCDILIDQNLGSKKDDYNNLVNQDCKILAGSSYALLRKEFFETRNKSLEKRKNTTNIKKILVNFGGSDLKNHSLKALKEIENSSFNGDIEVVLGFKSPNLKEIQEFSKSSRNNIKIHNLANMAQIIHECDLAIAAGGSSAWERCCLGLPTYVIKIADNQDKIYQELGFAGSFNEFLEYSQQNYQKLSLKLSNYVDGMGTERVYKEIEFICNSCVEFNIN